MSVFRTMPLADEWATTQQQPTVSETTWSKKSAVPCIRNIKLVVRKLTILKPMKRSTYQNPFPEFILFKIFNEGLPCGYILEVQKFCTNSHWSYPNSLEEILRWKSFPRTRIRIWSHFDHFPCPCELLFPDVCYRQQLCNLSSYMRSCAFYFLDCS